MNRSDNLRPVSDRGCHAFDRTRPNVADGEYASPARPKRIMVVARVGPRENEAAAIQLDARPRQPVGVRFRADDRKEMCHLPPLLGARCPIAEGYRRQLAFLAFQGTDFSANNDIDIRQAFDPFFVFDMAIGVSGAQPTELFTRALDQAWNAAPG